MSLPKFYREDPAFVMRSAPLPDDVYKRALESFVNVCADVVPIDRKRKTLFFTKRRIAPGKGWWWFGGRIWAGEEIASALQRVFKRETSLDCDPSRFQFVSLNRYIHPTRHQEPKNRGRDDLVFTFVVELTVTERELLAARLDPHEYDVAVGLQEFDRARCIAERVHPAIIDLYDSVFK